MTQPVLDVSPFERIVFFTGAGLSAASGLSTYRGQGGIWKDYDYRSVACQEAFERHPGVVWDFHDQRRAKAAAAEPNAAHRLVAAVQAAVLGTRIVTQNIDGLHQRAGGTDVLELHGSLWGVRCDREGKRWEERRLPPPSRHCDCGAWLRPDIVWFGDALDADTLEAAVAAAAACDLFVSVGTSLVVYPAAALPGIARANGATCVEVNPEPSALAGTFDVSLRTGAAEGLALLWPGLVQQAR